MAFECPVCQTSNPDSSAACGKCATPNPFLTSSGDSGVQTIAAPFPGTGALSGGLTTPLVSGLGSPGTAAARARSASGSTLFPGAVLAGRLERNYRSQVIFTFGGGTNEIQRDIIGMVALGLPRVNR